MTTQAVRRQDRFEIPKLILGVGIDYLRWTQLVPMVFAWFFLLVLVVAMVVLNFQGSIDAMLGAAEARYEVWFGPIEPLANAEDIEITETSVKTWIYRVWTLTALAGYLVGLLRGWLFGPWTPMGLKRKLVVVGVCAAACSVIMFLIWLFGAMDVETSAVMFAYFIAGPLLVWIISAYSLGVGHLLQLLSARLHGPQHPAL